MKFKLEQYFYKVILFVLFFLTFQIVVSAADLNITYPPTDETRLLQNQKVGISWEVTNTVNPTFKYQLNLKDALCKQTIKGIQQSQNPLKAGKYNAVLDLKSLENSTYCLNLCIYDLTEQECYNRTFVLTDTLENVSVSDENDGSNKPPKILSYPSILNLNYKQNFFYQITAEDPNGDAFTYRLISAPDFIYLNQKNGTITNTNIMRPGNYFVAFVVIDRNGSYIQQNFTINVFERYDSDGKPTEQPTQPVDPNKQQVFDITKPRSGELISATDNLIQWNVKNINYDKANIYYQKADGEWTLLKVIENSGIKEMEWDVTGLTSGQYKIKVELKKGNSVVNSKEVNNLIVGNDVNSSSLLIINLKPINQSETDQTKPEISANIIPSDGGKIIKDKVEVWLDNKKITSQCSVNETEIKCEVENDLSLKEHTVKMKVVDSNDQEVQQQWTFTVIEKLPDATPTDGTEPNPTTTPTVNRTNFLAQIGNNLGKIDSSIWLWSCGGLLALVLLFFAIRFLRERNANSYYSRTSPEETTEAELASVVPESKESNTEDNELEDFTDYSVGDFSVGDNYEPIVPSTQHEGPSSQLNTNTTDTTQTSDSSLATPNFGASDSDILPDWLKGDSEESSKPVNSEGEIMDSANGGISINDGAKVHDDFGLTDDNSGDEDKKKTA